MSILLFTGNSGAGKTTIARRVCQEHTGLYISEREMSRSIAYGQGFERSRLWAEHVGHILAATSIREHTLATIKDSDDSLITIDGAYDHKLLEAIQKSFPQAAIGIVAVEAPLELRIKRCARRLGGATLAAAAEDVAFLDYLKYEAGMTTVMQNANLHLDGEKSIEYACKQVNALLATLS